MILYKWDGARSIELAVFVYMIMATHNLNGSNTDTTTIPILTTIDRNNNDDNHNRVRTTKAHFIEMDD